MTQSTIQPDEIYIDKIKNGRARLLARWNIETVTRTDEMSGEEQTIYQYDEAVLWWVFPLLDNGVQLDNIDAITQYIQNNKDEILNFAKGSKVTL